MFDGDYNDLDEDAPEGHSGDDGEEYTLAGEGRARGPKRLRRDDSSGEEADPLLISPELERLRESHERLQKDYTELKERNAQVVREYAALETENERLKASQQHGDEKRKELEDKLKELEPPAGPRPELKLVQVVASRGQTPLSQVVPPYRFAGKGPFPTGVYEGEMQVESRRVTVYAFQLQHKHDGSPATEHDIGDLHSKFKIEFIYAQDGSVVRPSDFRRIALPSLTTPSLEGVAEQYMTNGQLCWKLRCNFTSADTRPRMARLRVKVSPVGGAAADMPDLTVESIPFVLRSKCQAPREGA